MLPRLSFQPGFSLGSSPGKQEKHLNRWKMCLTALGRTAPLCPAILPRCKTLQPHQLESVGRTTIMKWGVKYGSGGRQAGLMVSQGDFYEVFNVHTHRLRCLLSSEGWNRISGKLGAATLLRSRRLMSWRQQPAGFLRGFSFVQEKQKLACLTLAACMRVTVH